MEKIWCCVVLHCKSLQSYENDSLKCTKLYTQNRAQLHLSDFVFAYTYYDMFVDF